PAVRMACDRGTTRGAAGGARIRRRGCGMRRPLAGERCTWARRRPERLWAGAAMGRVNRGPYAGPAHRAGTGPARGCARWAPCSSRLAPWWLPKVSEAVDPQPSGPRPATAVRRLDFLGVLWVGASGDRTGPAATPHARPGRPGAPARR